MEVSQLIDRIRIIPLAGRGKFDIDLTPHLPALVALAMDPSWAFDRPDEEGSA